MPRISGYYIAVTYIGVTMSPFLGGRRDPTWTAKTETRRFQACAVLQLKDAKKS
jgi:hypothetical protein